MNAKPGHETSDLPPGPATLAIAGLLSLIAIAALVAWALSASFRRGHPTIQPTAFERGAAKPAFPQLETDPRADRIAVERRAQAHLEGYGWSDRRAGLARIPIERAMALQAAEGWPDADAAPSDRAGERAP
jgi:hypothetical protein